MLKLNKFIGFLICLEIIFIATMIPYKIGIPIKNIDLTIVNFPITFQVTSFILLTSIFTDKLVIKAYITYLIIGLFFLPTLYGGGSLGYMLTPNFGYLLGIVPLIIVINRLNKRKNVKIIEIFKTCICSLMVMHIIGISYLSIKLIMLNKFSLIPYNISLYSLSKIPYEILTLIPTIFVIKIINNYKSKDK